MAYRILVVDDSQLARSLAGGLLRKNPEYDVVLAEDGKQALEQISAEPPDLVLTDLMMPEMDGLELVRTLRQSHPELPVILMTAHGNEMLAVEALEAGAASYVPKAQQAERLLETVANVLEHAAADGRCGRLSRCVLQYEWRLELENDSALIAPLVRQVLEMMASVRFADRGERIRVGQALEQALLNAMYHGNLEISERELVDMGMDLDDPRFKALVEQRQSQPQYCDRKVLVVVRISPTEARFVIRDEGVGYPATSRVAQARTSHIENGRRRGLMLVRSLMDELKFNDRGNELRMRKGTPSPPTFPQNGADHIEIDC